MTTLLQGIPSWAQVGGRRIKVFDDTKTQSVNICTSGNTEGIYEQVFYFRDKFRVTALEINQQPNLATLTKWLRERSYCQLQ